MEGTKMANEIMKTTNIDITSINLNKIRNDHLREITHEILGIYIDAAEYAQGKNRAVAELLSEVNETKCYTDDGFSSMADYALEYFGIAKQNAHALARAGRKYKDTLLSEGIKCLSPSKLSEIGNIPTETLNKDYNDGKFSELSTQKELREYANVSSKSVDSKEKKARTKKVKEVPQMSYLVSVVNTTMGIDFKRELSGLYLPQTNWSDYIIARYSEEEGHEMWLAGSRTCEESGAITMVFVRGKDMLMVDLHETGIEMTQDKVQSCIEIHDKRISTVDIGTVNGEGAA